MPYSVEMDEGVEEDQNLTLIHSPFSATLPLNFYLNQDPTIQGENDDATAGGTPRLLEIPN